MTKYICDICKKVYKGYDGCKFIYTGAANCSIDVCPDCMCKIKGNNQEVRNAAANAINSIINKPESEKSSNANPTE